MLKQQEYCEVINTLVNKNTKRISKPFSQDLNHAWYLVGLAYYKHENYNEALHAFMKANRNWKDDIAAIRAIGNCYSELGKPKSAKYYFIKARDMGGRKYKDLNILNYNIGNAYFDLGKYQLAIDEYKKVKKSDEITYDLTKKNIRACKKRLAS